MSIVKTVGICVNTQKPDARRIYARISRGLRRRGIRVVGGAGPSVKGLIERSDLVIALGGDGTLLNVVGRMTPRHHPPVLGVNIGGLGFLTALSTSEIDRTLSAVLRGRFHASDRILLEVQVHGSRRRYFALNDAVINRGAFARILRLDIRVNGEPLGRYPSDGVIVATATGSTAHSLSGGGPIVQSDLEALVINPVCPHTLSSRPVVLSAENRIEVILDREAEGAGLTVDGQRGRRLKPGARVTIRQAPFRARLFGSPSRSYWRLLREKLSLSARHEGRTRAR